jgi:hypothetical protein
MENERRGWAAARLGTGLNWWGSAKGGVAVGGMGGALVGRQDSAGEVMVEDGLHDAIIECFRNKKITKCRRECFGFR